MLPGPACNGHLATGTFYVDDVPTGTCTYHKIQVQPVNPSGDGSGGTTSPGTGNGGTTTDPGTGNGGTTTDPGTGNGGTTDPGTGNGGTTDPAPPPAEGGTDTGARRRRWQYPRAG